MGKKLKLYVFILSLLLLLSLGNTAIAEGITPDLIITSIGNIPSNVARGESFSLTDKIKNEGGKTARPSTVRYYFSLDRKKSKNDILLTGSRRVASLKLNKFSRGRAKITIPLETPLNSYYLIVCADDKKTVKESKEDNNCAISSTKMTVRVQGFYYSFDESGSVITDNSGNNYDGVPVAISRVEGKVGKAIKFLSKGSKIEFPSFNLMPFNDGMTFMTWVKTDSFISDRQQIFGGWTPGSGFYPISNFGISIVNNKLSFEVSSSPYMSSIESNELNIIPSEWFHIAITYNGDEVRMYYNGELTNIGSLIVSFDGTRSNQIGHNYRVFSGITILDQFYGCLDEFYLKDIILTDDEISDYYENING